jgi:hypothetical protein
MNRREKLAELADATEGLCCIIARWAKGDIPSKDKEYSFSLAKYVVKALSPLVQIERCRDRIKKTKEEQESHNRVAAEWIEKLTRDIRELEGEPL